MERFFIDTKKISANLEPLDDRSLALFCPTLFDEYGFFQYNKYVSDLKSLSDMLNLDGAIIIAECGMGKTFSMQTMKKKLPPDEVIFLSAAEYCNAVDDFSAALSNIDEQVHSIFVDGIDENPAIVSTLFRKLSQCSGKKIFIASRNINAIEQLKNRLKLPVYSLLPLMQEDIIVLAQDKQVNGETFLKAVIKKGLSPICARPLGCQQLLNIYKRDNGLNNLTSDSLWKKSMESLCLENDSETRSLLTNERIITLDETKSCIAKIALITKLFGFNSIYAISNSVTECDKIHFSNFFIQEREILVFNEILKRSVFIPVGDKCFKFAHISYQDYWAAVGLQTFIQERYWNSILLSSSSNAVYPQWEGVAEWLAVFSNDWKKRLLDIQPELLFASDNIVQTITPQILCQALLERVDSVDSWSNHWYSLKNHLYILNSPTICPILQQTLNSSSSDSKKELAIDIVRECRFYYLEQNVVDIFCNPNEALPLRQHAGYALKAFASDDAKVKCKAILADSKCDFSLKGILFAMTWPNLITMAEMGPHLLDIDRHIIDSYHMWIACECPQTLPNLSEKQAFEALSWAVTDVPQPQGIEHSVYDLRREIFTLCYKKFFRLPFIELLCKGYLLFYNRYPSPFVDETVHGAPEELFYSKEQFNLDIDKRHILLECLIKMPDIAVEKIRSCLIHLFLRDDISFIFQKIDEATDIMQKARWVQCLNQLRYLVKFPEMSDKWDTVYAQYPKILECDSAKLIQERTKSNQKFEQDESQYQKKIQASIHKRQQTRDNNIKSIKKFLNNHTANQIIPGIITFFINETNLDTIDFRDSEIWQEFSDEERIELVKAAYQYLITTPAPVHEPGKGYSIFPRVAFLLFSENNEFFRQLPENDFQKILIEIFDYLGFDHENILFPILKFAHNEYPDFFRKQVVKKIQHDVEHGYGTNFSKYESFLNPELCKDIIDLCIGNNYDDSKRFRILDDIKPYCRQGVYNFLRVHILERSTQCNAWGNRTSLLIFEFFPEKISDFIEKINTDTAWGIQWLNDVINLDCLNKPLDNAFINIKLKEKAEFYIWLHKNYPAKNEPDYNDENVPRLLNDIYVFKKRLFNMIANANECGVVQALHHIHRAFPQDTWIETNCIPKAKRRELQLQMPQYTIDEISALMESNRQGYLINTPQDLLQVILDKLSEYQIYLTGKNLPRVEDLWNVGNNITHKREEDFSDHLASFLRERLQNTGIVINREVQINRGRNGEAGARTDIWIDVFSHARENQFSLCIEVKGSWNSSAPTAMKEQLVHKYMEQNAANAGILLVGWFQSQSYPQSVMWNNNRENAKKDLEQQAKTFRQTGLLVESVIIDCNYKE